MKTQKRKAAEKRITTEAAPVAPQAPELPPTTTVMHEGYPPPPEILYRMAEEEPDRKLLYDYRGAIRHLRDEKRFTFREIAEWLGERGIQADHNAVYRTYTKGLSDGEAARAAQDDDMDEREQHLG